ncbi:MAG TPA: hypothetical protein VFR41_04120, partial [Acidimicrobiia bacterium]|nr:hypothetical protein [Acidimicrobiia bacterium]
EIDSPTHSLGTTTCDNDGKVNVVVHIGTSGPMGPHKLVASGIQPGGQSLSLSSPVNIKVQGNCNTTTKGSTVPGQKQQGGGGPKTAGGGTDLPFTGTDAGELTLFGLGATALGRALYALAARRRDDEDEDEE